MLNSTNRIIFIICVYKKTKQIVKKTLFFHFIQLSLNFMDFLLNILIIYQNKKKKEKYTRIVRLVLREQVQIIVKRIMIIILDFILVGKGRCGGHRRCSLDKHRKLLIDG